MASNRSGRTSSEYASAFGRLDLARPHGPGGHGGRDAQDVRPVPVDQVRVHLAADQWPEQLRDTGAFEHVQPLRRQVPDARDERVAEDRARGEDMVGEATGIGVLFADAPPGLVHQESVEDVGGFVDGSPAEARRLLEVIDTGTLAGLRDRALLSVMLYSFARVSAVVAMRRADYFRQESRGWLRLHEKGGKRHDVPAHHRAAEAIDDYIEAGDLDEVKAPLFQTVDPAGQRLTGRALSRRLVLAMIKRRAAAADLPA